MFENYLILIRNGSLEKLVVIKNNYKYFLEKYFGLDIIINCIEK